MLRVSIPLPPDVNTAGERLVTELDLEGYSEVEFRRDEQGNAVLMEINPRLSASVEVAVRAGVPLSRLLYAWAAGEPLEPVDRYRTGVRMRWLGGDLKWLESAMRERRRPDLPGRAKALGTFMADFARPTGYDSWDPRDPRPALVAAAGAGRDTGGRASRRDPARDRGRGHRNDGFRRRHGRGCDRRRPLRALALGSPHRQRRPARDLRRDHGRLGRAHARGDEAQVRGVRLEPLGSVG